MRGCPNIDYTTYSGAWTTAREYFGPKPASLSDSDRLSLYGIDLNAYGEWLNLWNSEHNTSLSGTSVQFGKWVVWRLSIGTVNYSNAPERKRDHTGIQGIYCPFDLNQEKRAEIYLSNYPYIDSNNSIQIIYSDHSNHYMKVSQRVSAWGFECTYSGCQYKEEFGQSYFYM